MAETHRDDIAKLEALYAENPEGRVFIHLAEAYRRAGELDRALEVVTDGISRYAEDSSAHVVLGRVLEDRQQDDEAAAAFRRVLELDAHNLVALRGLGDLAFRAGHHQAALEYFERLAEIEPPDGELEALIEALRSGPAGMAEALEQWSDEEPAEAEPGAEVERRAEAVDFAGGTLAGGGAVVSEVGETYAETPPAEAPVGPFAEEPAETEAEEDVAPEFDEADESEAAQASSFPPEPEISRSPETWQSAYADEGDAAPVTEEEAPDWTPEEPEGLQTEEGLRGEDALDEAGSLDVTEPDFHEAAREEADLPRVGGVEGLQTADSPVSGEPLPETGAMWGVEDEAEEAVEATPTVFTETMAQVYARQGLYDRAADVYRELLRQRPGDAALETRLAEMQELHAGADAGGPEAETPEEPFPFMDAGPTTEPAGYTEAPPAPGRDPWAPERDEAEFAEDREPESAGEGEFAGEPESGEEWASAGEADEGDEWASAGEAGYGEAPGFRASTEEAAQSREPGAVEESVAGEMRGTSQDLPAEEVAEDVESVWTGAGGAVGGEETPYSWTEPEEREAGGESLGEGIRSYLLRLAGWASGSGGAASAAGAPEPEDAPAAQDAGEMESAPPKQAGATPPGEDDDLDMFRAWLESLKR